MTNDQQPTQERNEMKLTEEQIEAHIDGPGLLDLLCMIDIICAEKALHLESNWQDKNTAKQWHRASGIIYTCASSIQDKTDIV